MKKKILSMILICILSMNFVSFASAEEVFPDDDHDYSAELEHVDGIENLGRWKYTSSTTQSVYVDSSGCLTGTVSIVGHNDVTKILCYMYPERLVGNQWKILDTYTDTYYKNHMAVEHYYYGCPKGYTYRIHASIYVYVGNTYEHISVYSGNWYY